MILITLVTAFIIRSRYYFAAVTFIYRLCRAFVATPSLVAVTRKGSHARNKKKKKTCRNEVEKRKAHCVTGGRAGERAGRIGGLRMASLRYRIMTSVMRDAIIAGKRRPGHRQKYYLWLREEGRGGQEGRAQIAILAIVKYGRLVLSEERAFTVG